MCLPDPSIKNLPNIKIKGTAIKKNILYKKFNLKY